MYQFESDKKPRCYERFTQWLFSHKRSVYLGVLLDNSTTTRQQHYITHILAFSLNWTIHSRPHLMTCLDQRWLSNSNIFSIPTHSSHVKKSATCVALTWLLRSQKVESYYTFALQYMLSIVPRPSRAEMASFIKKMDIPVKGERKRNGCVEEFCILMEGPPRILTKYLISWLIHFLIYMYIILYSVSEKALLISLKCCNTQCSNTQCSNTQCSNTQCSNTQCSKSCILFHSLAQPYSIFLWNVWYREYGKIQWHPLGTVYNDLLAFYFVWLEQLVMAALLAHVCQPSEATHNTKYMKLCQVILHSAPRNITDVFKAKIQGSRCTLYCNHSQF